MEATPIATCGGASERHSSSSGITVEVGEGVLFGGDARSGGAELRERQLRWHSPVSWSLAERRLRGHPHLPTQCRETRDEFCARIAPVARTWRSRHRVARDSRRTAVLDDREPTARGSQRVSAWRTKQNPFPDGPARTLTPRNNQGDETNQPSRRGGRKRSQPMARNPAVG